MEIHLLVGFFGLLEGNQRICELSNERWLKPFVLQNQGDFGTCIYQKDANGRWHDAIMIRPNCASGAVSLFCHVRTSHCTHHRKLEEDGDPMDAIYNSEEYSDVVTAMVEKGLHFWIQSFKGKSPVPDFNDTVFPPFLRVT